MYWLQPESNPCEAPHYIFYELSLTMTMWMSPLLVHLFLSHFSLHLFFFYYGLLQHLVTNQLPEKWPFVVSSCGRCWWHCQVSLLPHVSIGLECSLIILIIFFHLMFHLFLCSCSHISLSGLFVLFIPWNIYFYHLTDGSQLFNFFLNIQIFRDTEMCAFIIWRPRFVFWITRKNAWNISFPLLVLDLSTDYSSLMQIKCQSLIHQYWSHCFAICKVVW